MDLLLKAIAGAAVVVLIQLLARTNNYHVAGLVPLFPTFTLISHYVVGRARTTAELKQTILFGMLSMLPYLIYMLALYLLVDRWRLGRAIAGAVVGWLVAAVLLVAAWERFGPA